jgi:hypothetical protein
MRQRRTVAVVEQRRNQRILRDVRRSERTPSEQLELLDQRVGTTGAKRERTRLLAQMERMIEAVEAATATVEPKKPKRAKKGKKVDNQES